MNRELILEKAGITLKNLFPEPNNEEEENESADLAVNKELARTCIVSILADLSDKEAKEWVKNTISLPRLLLQALEQSNLDKESKNAAQDRILSLNESDLARPSSITDKLDLLNIDGEICRLEEDLASSLSRNQAAAEAHALLNLEE